MLQVGKEFEVNNDGESAVGTNGDIVATVDGGRMFKRNAIKNATSPAAYKEQWLVCELDGVRCYVRTQGGQVHIVMSKDDLYP